MPMILVDASELKKLPEGLVVQCALCQHPRDRRQGEAACDVVGKAVNLEVLRICSSFEERH